MLRKLIGPALLSALMATPAFAGWKVNCTGGDLGTTGVPNMSPGSDYCYSFTDATDPPRVNAGLCRSVHIFVDADVAQVGTASDVTVHAYQCRTATSSDSGQADCEKILIDRDGDGVADDTAMTGLTAPIYNAPPTRLSFDMASGDPSGTAEVKLVCVRP